jgi:UDP-N-acetylmuramoyl-L-alanyl-D-glutamate--2,6-diaminopimelate ligase
MKLTEIIRLLQPLQITRGHQREPDFTVKGISAYSKAVKPGFAFVAIKGGSCDGNMFIREAILRGAQVVIIGPQVRLSRNAQPRVSIRVKDTRAALARLAAAFNGNPSTRLKVVGITGTNGKTTVSYLIESILKHAGFDPAVIGTVNYRYHQQTFPSKNTTPGPMELQPLLKNMVSAGVDYAVMEVSSHALHQERTEGITFHSAVFTNVTQDHLDYHKTIENYFKAKCKLFSCLRAGAFAVTNNDCLYGRRIKDICKVDMISYGIRNRAQVMARDIRMSQVRTTFKVASPAGELCFNVRLIGCHNVYNILAAVSWGIKAGIDLPVIRRAIEGFRCVPGRLERIEQSKKFSVFVDYAHTDDALKNVIEALRHIAQQRIIVVFGCGGDRDVTKRAKMGRVVSSLADFAFITNDNPRSEDPDKIIADITQGMRSHNYCVIADRGEAIRKSLSYAQRGDIVLVAGKGHEDYQIIKDKVIHFDDREVVRACLRSMN